MNEFVGQCRSEWKRLGVPDQVADEMAAELAADLEEAAAEGVSQQEVLGAPLEPRAFARTWAVERGVARVRTRRLPFITVAGTLSVAAVAAAVAILVTPSGATTSALPLRYGPELRQIWITQTGADGGSGRPTIALNPSAPPGSSGTNADAETAAWALLATGAAGLALAGGLRVRIGRHASHLRASLP